MTKTFIKLIIKKMKSQIKKAEKEIIFDKSLLEFYKKELSK